MVDKIRRTTGRWANYHLSPAAKGILINSVLLFVPLYTMSVYPIPDFIISEISKIVRKFFWSRHGNGTAIHNVSWNIVTEGKSEGA